MNARRGLEHLGARAGRGSRPEELPGLSRGSPQPPLARGAPHTPLTTLPQPPHLRLCLLAPAGRSGALRTPGAPICALQIPRNVKLGAEGSREGRQKLGASHPLGNLRSFPVLRGPVGTQTPTPPSRGDFVFRVRLHLYLYLRLSRSPTFPWLQKPGCLCPGHPHSVHSPSLSPAVSPNLPGPSVLFCMALQLWRKWKPSSP